jgi:hypothetical protein
MINIKFDKAINGELLVTEFAKAGFTTEVTIMPNGLLELNGVTEKDVEAAKQILEAHKAPKTTEPSIEQKLASVGLSVDDLKAALGL